MSADPHTPERVVKRRPKDRKAQIARASADAFSALGFHAVSMEEIASRVGISAPALYRHSTSKYELFRDAVIGLGRQLLECTAFADEPPPDAEPAALLDELIGALVETSIANRTAGGLYRWEGRYLHSDDQAVLMDQIKTVNRRLQTPLAALRPELISRERWTLSVAALSAIGSIADHRAPLPAREIRLVLSGLASDLLAAELPPAEPLLPGPVVAAAARVQPSRYETLLRASLLLFNERGYRETSVEDIAAAAGLPASGIYRYFTSKGDVLAASFRRAADRISSDITNTLAVQHNPKQALVALIAAYVARSFANPELAYVYYTERVNLPPVDRLILRNMQRATVEAWVRLLVEVRPELTPGRARFAVHAAFGLVVDLGRLVQYDNTEAARACVRRLMEVTLFGP
jgi:AcrR family transcriptional regulator